MVSDRESRSTADSGATDGGYCGYSIIGMAKRSGEWPLWIKLEHGSDFRGYYLADRDALLSVARDLGCKADELESQCPEYVRSWHAAAALGKAARDIREALGVEE